MSIFNGVDHWFQCAVRANDYSAVEKIIEIFGLERLPSLTENFALLCEVIRQGNKEMARLLINKGCVINPKCLSALCRTPLHYAAFFEDVEMVGALIRKGVNVNALEKDHGTPLHIAAARGNCGVSKALLDAGARIDARDSYGRTPLYLAVKNNQVLVVGLFITYQVDVNLQCITRSKKSHTPLGLALENANEAIVDVLLKNGAYVDCEISGGHTPLSYAIERSLDRIVRCLVRYSPDRLNESNKEAFYAALEGRAYLRSDTIQILYWYGFGINCRDIRNAKILRNCVTEGYKNILEDLLRYGADPNTKVTHCDLCVSEFSLLHFAAEYNRLEIAQMLIDHGADVNKFLVDRTPLSTAVDANNVEIAALLLEHHADLGYSLHGAVHEGNRKMVMLLLTHGADVNGYDDLGRVPLHVAALNGNVRMAALLLKNGADVNARDQLHMRTPLHYAALKARSWDVVHLLLSYDANVHLRDDTRSLAFHEVLRCGCDITFTAKFTRARSVTRVTRFINVAVRFEEVLKPFLARGVDVNAIDETGETPLHIVARIAPVNIIKLLINHDADINALHTAGYVPLDTAIHGMEVPLSERRQLLGDPNFDGHYYMNPEVTMFMTEYIIKLKAAGLPVNERNLALTEDDPNCIYEACKYEVNSMIQEKVHNHVSFYDILTKSSNAVATYMGNGELLKALYTSDYRMKFPIYAEMLDKKILDGERRRPLMQIGTQALDDLVNFQLPDVVTRKIIRMLNNDDLRMLGEVFED